MADGSVSRLAPQNARANYPDWPTEARSTYQDIATAHMTDRMDACDATNLGRPDQAGALGDLAGSRDPDRSRGTDRLTQLA
jgi:hypothetical protein